MNMYLHPVSIAWLSFCFLITFKTCIDGPSAYLTGDVSINCGSKETSAANNGREWAGDTHPKIAPSLQIKGSSTISSVINKFILADPVPYRNARISRSTFSYSFLTEPGQKFIRLHFNPTAYKGFQKFEDLFTVEAGSFTLLQNFSATLTAGALEVKSFVKEFCINVQENQKLKMVFSSQSPDTYAFINGIEIKSVPSPHSYLHGVGVGVGESTALEMVHREKVKQDTLLPNDDSSDLFGMWKTRQKEKPNQINNMKWKIPVYVGFRYLVRLHFSQLGLEMTETVDVILKVLGKEMTADIIVERDKNGILGYRDYLVLMTGRKEEKRVLLIYLQSKDKFPVGKRPLMGFEIFKISNHDNSLASPNPMSLEPSLPFWTIESLLLVLGHRNAIPTVIALVCSIVYKLREIWEANKEKEENKPSARAQRFCRRFSLEEIQLATRNFSQELLIGKGGFGNVYKGVIGNGGEIVAIKRLKPSSKQGATEFLTEIETLSELKHLNLVSLIGYCNEPGEMILVYEYLSGGTLSDHLHNPATRKNKFSCLTWKQCLGIRIGAGRGLEYLHTGCEIIHGDVKASNILLDDNLMAKFSDFGTAKHENGSNLQSEDKTLIKGTRGYLDPYYLSNHELTRKSDIYAFGVVLLEVLCGRPAFDPSVARDEHVLTEWARDKISKGEVDRIVLASLREEISPDGLESFLKISTRCLHDDPKKRPTMAQVVLQLESILEQNDSTITFVQNETSVAEDMGPSKDAKNTPAAAVSEQVFPTGRNEQRQNMSKIAIAEPSSIRTTEAHKSVAEDMGPSKDAKNTPWVAVSEQDFTTVWNELRQNMRKMNITEPSSIRTTEAHKPCMNDRLDNSHAKTEMPVERQKGNDLIKFLNNSAKGIQRKTKAGKKRDRAIVEKPVIPSFGEWDESTEPWTIGDPGHTGPVIIKDLGGEYYDKRV